MSSLQLLFLGFVFVGVGALVAGAATWLGSGVVRQRVRDRALGAPERHGAAGRWVQRVAELTSHVGQLSVPAEGFERSSLRLQFMHAGIRAASAPGAYFGVKTMLTIALPVVGYLAMASAGVHPRGTMLMLVTLMLAALGYYLPNGWLARRVSHRQREIFEVFPDALDLMTVCVEAGLGTEAALVRVAEDMDVKSPALAEELRLVNLELRAGAAREQALRNLAVRTGVEEVEGFVAMFNQAERFGTSIAASLRVHSDMLRTRRRQKAEEAAAKVALKLLFPLIFCIFPSLMLVLMGPAMIHIYRSLLPTFSGAQ